MILILGGTTEGRLAVNVMDEAGTPYFYATRGNEQQITCKNGQHLTGGMNTEEMASFCKKNHIRALVDAAHPFAIALHHTVSEVAETCELPVIRIERHYSEHHPSLIWCKDFPEALSRLQEDTPQRLLALTGVQTLPALQPYWEQYDCYFRILDRESSRKQARENKFPAHKLVFYHETEAIEKLYDSIRPTAILTKESGESGGFEEKVQAALQRNIKVYVVCRPTLPDFFRIVTGPYGLRKAIEQAVPDFYPLRSGFTTGSCATVAAKAALIKLLGNKVPDEIPFSLPNGEILSMPIEGVEATFYPSGCIHTATASVIKDAGSDPDVTHRCRIQATVSFTSGSTIRFKGGEGVGTITLPGIGLPLGDPAINPVPRQMITHELRQLYSGGLEVTLSVPGGKELALKTFNPKLGITGGISILGTLGIVRPFSLEAWIESIRREIEVSRAVGVSHLVLNSGAKSEQYVKALYPDLPDQAFIHYGNFIGETLRISHELHVSEISLGIMLGKAVKLAEGHLDTHSKKATINREFLAGLARRCGCPPHTIRQIGEIALARELWDLLSSEEQILFFGALLASCHAHCRKVYPDGRLTLLLIDEKGRIPFRKTT